LMRAAQQALMHGGGAGGPSIRAGWHIHAVMFAREGCWVDHTRAVRSSRNGGAQGEEVTALIGTIRAIGCLVDASHRYMARAAAAADVGIVGCYCRWLGER
jgi:hypothetical protein